MKKKDNKLFIGIVIIFIIIVAFVLILNLNTKKEGNLISVSYSEINKKIDNKDSFMLVVSQSTCSHCASYKPKLIQVAKENYIDIYYIDYDQDKNGEKFLEKFDLDGSTPITLFIKDGKEDSVLNRLEGDSTKSKVIEKKKKMGFID